MIVPISFLTTGTYRVRALVFKAICDLFGIPCSLETGDYRKTWNVVLLRPDERFVNIQASQFDFQPISMSIINIFYNFYSHVCVHVRMRQRNKDKTLCILIPLENMLLTLCSNLEYFCHLGHLSQKRTLVLRNL